MLVDIFEPSMTTASGSASANTSKYTSVLANQLYVKSTTATTKFDVTLTDRKGRAIAEFKRVRGTLNKILNIALTGIYTLAITNAGADEAFTVYLAVQEKV